MELAVLANLAIGFHEQTRLQPQIREALDAGYATKEDLGRRALDALFPSAARLWPIVRRPAATVVGVIAAGAQRGTSRLAREVMAEQLMVLALPGRVVALSAHLGDTYPEPLREPADTALDRVPGQVRARPAGSRSVPEAPPTGRPSINECITSCTCSARFRYITSSPVLLLRRSRNCDRAALVPDGEL